MKLRLGTALCLIASTSNAEQLRFPSNATLVSETSTENATYALPVGPFDGAEVETETINGTVTRQVWVLDAPDQSTTQTLRPLREQLRNAGYRVAFTCDTDACGGFDFRFGIDVAAPPAMFVNLADFSQVSALRTTEDGQTEAVSVLASRNDGRGYVQLISVGAATPLVGQPTEPSASATVATGSIADQLDRVGHAVIEGLSFERGSAQLSVDRPDALRDVADYLEANPLIDIALVGHTDAEGTLDGNIVLSRRRAASVLERLSTEFGIDRSRMQAQGMGYLAPIATNRTAEGRELNRRVEVIVTTTDP